MRPSAGYSAALLALAVAAAPSRADLIYQTQDRFITASTTYDQNTQTLTSPGFGPFVENLNLSTMFPAPGGGTGTNEAAVGIDCELDPNAIRVSGSLLGEGGLAVTGTGTTLQMAEARARVAVDFHLDAATSFNLFSTPRPSTRPGDRFKIKLEDRTAHIVLFFIDEGMPAQTVNLNGVLGVGDFSLEYECEMTVDGPQSLAEYQFNLTVPAPSGAALLACAGLFAVRRRR